jgi:hypothetical protein
MERLRIYTILLVNDLCFMGTKPLSLEQINVLPFIKFLNGWDKKES